MKNIRLLALSIGVILPPFSSADNIINDDLIVTGSECIGFDCANGENFGFDTLRLKENNLRIHFQDTSASASFPSNDWRIVINDTANGGANYFAVEDSTANRVPFKLEAGAPANSLFVKSNGNLGVGTANPIVNIHTTEGNTPTLRLEQDGSSGFTAQTWDVAGNEANFFIRDATNGSLLPFKIKPGAPTNSFYIDSDGDIGLGTASPNGRVAVRNTENNKTILSLANSGHLVVGADTPSSYYSVKANIDIRGNTAEHSMLGINTSGEEKSGSIAFYGDGNRKWLISSRNGSDSSYGNIDDRLAIYGNTANEIFTIHQSGNVYIGDSGGNTTNTTHAIDTPSGAHLTVGGVWTNASSRALKEKITSITASTALDALKGLNPVTYVYKNEPNEIYAGFIAEDVPSIVATNDRKSLSPMDIVAVLTKVVQEQEIIIEKLSDRLDKLEKK